MWLVYWNFTESKSIFAFCCWSTQTQVDLEWVTETASILLVLSGSFVTSSQVWTASSSVRWSWEALLALLWLLIVLFSCCKRWKNEYIGCKAHIVSFCGCLPSIKSTIVCLFYMVRTFSWHSVSVTLHCSDLFIVISPPLSFEGVHVFFVFLTIEWFCTIVISLTNRKMLTLPPCCWSDTNMLVCWILSANFLMICTDLFSDIYWSAMLTLEKWLFSFDHKMKIILLKVPPAFPLFNELLSQDWSFIISWLDQFSQEVFQLTNILVQVLSTKQMVHILWLFFQDHQMSHMLRSAEFLHFRLQIIGLFSSVEKLWIKMIPFNLFPFWK